jgi:uncharacterized damage-inducible protein DinB
MEVQSKISNHIQAWQTAWQETWNLTEGLSEEALLQKPGHDKWSVQEVIQHLYISESISLDYIKYKLKDVHKVKKSSLMNSLRSLALSKHLLSSAVRQCHQGKIGQLPAKKWIIFISNL